MKIDLVALIVVILATAYQYISLSDHKAKSDESDLALYVLAICVQGMGFLLCGIRLGCVLKSFNVELQLFTATLCS
jgi:hypothetical protein